MTPFLFDFTLEKAQVSFTAENTVSPNRTVIADDSKKRCPYHIPTVDEILRLFEKTAGRINTNKLLADMLECGAIAVSNLVDLAQRAEREQRYSDIMRGYSAEDQAALAEIFTKIYMLLSSVVYADGVFDDYLGTIFMRCNSGNSHAGQFFTPYHISKFMALTTLDASVVKQKTADDDILTVSDPCCGGGGLLMAVLDVLNDLGVNYTRNCFMDAGDIDRRCVHMTYLQLSLAGVPAIVRHQNALTRELWGVWYTPAFCMQYPRFHKYANALT